MQNLCEWVFRVVILGIFLKESPETEREDLGRDNLFWRCEAGGMRMVSFLGGDGDGGMFHAVVFVRHCGERSHSSRFRCRAIDAWYMLFVSSAAIYRLRNGSREHDSSISGSVKFLDSSRKWWFSLKCIACLGESSAGSRTSWPGARHGQVAGAAVDGCQPMSVHRTYGESCSSRVS